ncbi:tRNA 4-thiouridine(8) synthase ThiI [Cohnella endophytica]|uniref:Probable tRNA sulfurtransferase n=1 Tax=Cohnella endophytica TaxID=2419778 RepID=A0A494XXM1_9BACL|nr:tRNA uracil 4-sulfurtransferase ThiI [Cohnella endophytica]RKP55242.1 tRNA 4-thiouridine(8) synthase ThiI [Cohnella endophytica]
MKYDLILVRFGEITIKGRNRNRFETMLLTQIQMALKAMPALEYVRGYARVYIHLNGESYEKVSERLKDIFGIMTFSPVISTKHDLEAIRECALGLMQSIAPAPATFKVSVKRGWKQYPHDSLEMNHLVGAHVLRNSPGLKVDVRNPEVELKVDIQHLSAYVYCEVIKGAGGFPLGMNGKAMLLLSGGIDSPVAGWMSMRKGLKVEAVHFHSYPFTSEQAKEKVITLAKRLAYYGGKIKLHLVPFTEIQTKLAQAGQDSLIITLMRRSMLKITERLAEENGALAIVTGDSLGQVASQTLGSMNVIGRSAALPLLRPLVMMDKQDIITIAEQIDTFSTSILPFEDCCTLFVPKSPAINPNLKLVEKVEAHLGEEFERLIDEAVAGTEVLVLKEDGQETTEAQKEDAWF